MFSAPLTEYLYYLTNAHLSSVGHTYEEFFCEIRKKWEKEPNIQPTHKGTNAWMNNETQQNTLRQVFKSRILFSRMLEIKHQAFGKCWHGSGIRPAIELYGTVQFYGPA